jgi:hypothetical protein
MKHVTATTLLVAVVLAAGACGDDGGGIDLSGPAEVATGAPQMSPDASDDGDGDDDGASGVRTAVGGQGWGTVTVAGITFVADDASCVVDPAGMSFSGTAAGSDGSSAWVSVDYGISTRAEMAGSFDDETLQLLFPDGADIAEDLSIDVMVGRTSSFVDVEPAGDEPWWSTATAGGASDDVLVEFDTAALRGSGTAHDLNGPADGPGAPIEFDVRCP